MSGYLVLIRIGSMERLAVECDERRRLVREALVSDPEILRFLRGRKPDEFGVEGAIWDVSFSEYHTSEREAAHVYRLERPLGND